MLNQKYAHQRASHQRGGDQRAQQAQRPSPLTRAKDRREHRRAISHERGRAQTLNYARADHPKDGARPATVTTSVERE